MRHDRIDLPDRPILSRKSTRIPLTVLSSLLFLMLAVSGRGQLLVAEMLVLCLLWLALRHRRGLFRLRRDGTLDSTDARLLAHPAGNPRCDDAADASLCRPDLLIETGDAAVETTRSEPVDAEPDISSASETTEVLNPRVKERRRNPRKPPPEPPSARFVRIAPGRYVRVEETETQMDSGPDADREANDNLSEQPVSVCRELDDDAVDGNPSMDFGADMPSDTDLDSVTTPGQQDDGDSSPESERSMEAPLAGDEGQEDATRITRSSVREVIDRGGPDIAVIEQPERLDTVE